MRLISNESAAMAGAILAAEKVLDYTCNQILERARENAPVHDGELRDSLYVEIVGLLQRQVGSSSDHAIYVELGTRNMAARPFLAPAVAGLGK